MQRVADRSFAVIPYFVANFGMARTFAYLMKAQRGSERAIQDTSNCIRDPREALDATPTHRLLTGAVSCFLP